MRKRVTIVIDESIEKKIRQRQAKMIQQNQIVYSFSSALNEVLRKGLKKS